MVVEDRLAALEWRTSALEAQMRSLGAPGETPAAAPSGPRPEDPRALAAPRAGAGPLPTGLPVMPAPTPTGRPGSAGDQGPATLAGRPASAGGQAPASPGSLAGGPGSAGGQAPASPGSLAGGPGSAGGQAPASRRRPATAVRRPRPELDLEDFLGGSVLAWAGGAAVVTGLAFLLTVAISRGWLGEGARTLLAGALSLGLLALGARLRERRGRNDAALSAAAAGVAGLFGTLVVAGEVYSLVPVGIALLGALAVGALATALAIRWRAEAMGWLGLVGALLAPAALGALDGAGIAFLAVAYAATVGVLLWQRWTALGLAAFGIATAQWLYWLLADQPAAPAGLTALVVFGLLTTGAAVGFELRRGEQDIRKAAAALLALNAIVLDAAGWWYLHDAAGTLTANCWLVTVACVHLVVGLGSTSLPRVSRPLALAALGLGVVLADVAFAAWTSGLPLVLGWAAGAVGFAALLRRTTVPAGAEAAEAAPSPDRIFAAAGLAGHLLSALLHALVIDAPAGGQTGVEGLLAVAAVGAGAAIAGRLAAGDDPRWRTGLDALAMAMLAYLSWLALDGVALAAALAGEAVALAAVANREHDEVAGWGAIAFVGLAGAGALWVAPPTALLDGLGHPLAAASALAAAAGAAALTSRVMPGRLRTALQATAALTALYLASAAVVTAGGASGQTLLSVLWALCGVGALVTGLVRDNRALRHGAFGLLTLTATKVMLYDLASLTSLYRVGSLIGLGLLLLAGAFAWQRVRPLPLPDLREAGADAR